MKVPHKQQSQTPRPPAKVRSRPSQRTSTRTIGASGYRKTRRPLTATSFAARASAALASILPPAKSRNARSHGYICMGVRGEFHTLTGFDSQLAAQNASYRKRRCNGHQNVELHISSGTHHFRLCLWSIDVLRTLFCDGWNVFVGFASRHLRGRWP